MSIFCSIPLGYQRTFRVLRERLQQCIEYCMETHISLLVTSCISAQYCLKGDGTQLTGSRAALQNAVHTQYETKSKATHFKYSFLSLANSLSLLLLCCYSTELEALSTSIYLTPTMKTKKKRFSTLCCDAKTEECGVEWCSSIRALQILLYSSSGPLHELRVLARALVYNGVIGTSENLETIYLICGKIRLRIWFSKLLMIFLFLYNS